MLFEIQKNCKPSASKTNWLPTYVIRSGGGYSGSDHPQRIPQAPSRLPREIPVPELYTFSTTENYPWESRVARN